MVPSEKTQFAFHCTHNWRNVTRNWNTSDQHQWSKCMKFLTSEAGRWSTVPTVHILNIFL